MRFILIFLLSPIIGFSQSFSENLSSQPDSPRVKKVRKQKKTACQHLLHPNGDVLECEHLMHPSGDNNNTNSNSYYVPSVNGQPAHYNTIPTPCTHKLHNEHIIPCQHLIHPKGD